MRASNLVAVTVLVLALALVPPSLSRPTAKAQEPVGGAGTDLARVETVPVGQFSTVRAAGPGTLVIRPGPRPALTIRAQRADLARISIDSGDGELRLAYQGGRVFDGLPPPPIRYELTIVDLAELRAANGIIVAAEALHLTNLRLYVSSGSEVQLRDLRATSLAAKIDGGASLTVSGQVQSQDITLQDGAHYDGSGLASRDVKLDLCCATIATVRVSGKLDVVAAGASTVNYIGDPDITFDLSDGSTLRRLRPIATPAATPP